MKKTHTATGLRYEIRKAKIGDVPDMQKLINRFGADGTMLPRSLSEIFETLRDFHVCRGEGGMLGVCALHVAWENLAEIKSLAVAPDFQRRGIGSDLVRRCLREAADLGIRRVFALTYESDFFRKLGFHLTDKDVLPQKVWGECIKCVKFPDCNEVAMIHEGEGEG